MPTARGDVGQTAPRSPLVIFGLSARPPRSEQVNGKNVLVLVIIVVVLYVLMKDPVGAAGNVRGVLTAIWNGVSTILSSLVTFLRSLIV